MTDVTGMAGLVERMTEREFLTYLLWLFGQSDLEIHREHQVITLNLDIVLPEPEPQQPAVTRKD